jgi:UDP-2,4-diacetamido-2,4,6-trideoxy-beta-L-altropyranose hydrolase
LKPNVFIRCDGGLSLGMGHITRCLALANMLKLDFEICFILRETEEKVIRLIRENTFAFEIIPEQQTVAAELSFLSYLVKKGAILVLDGYYFDLAYQQEIKKRHLKLVFIDDLIAFKQVADVVINQALAVKHQDYQKEDDTQLLLGLNYALLREPFFKLPSSRNIQKAEKVFISMGAADEHNMSLKVAKTLIQIPYLKEVHLMLGAINPHLKSIHEFIAQQDGVQFKIHVNISADELQNLLNQCDLAICAASGILIEACAVGIPLISGITADNQKDNLKGLAQQQVLFDIGNFLEIEPENLAKQIHQVVSQPEVLNQQMVKQKTLIDGKSPQRILQAFQDLAFSKLQFRFAQEQDCDLYYQWANDEVVRKNSFIQDAIPFENHVQWFKAKLQAVNCYFYMFFDRETNNPAGQVRIDKSGDEVIIGISIDEHFRGKSLGLEMLNKATLDYHHQNPEAVIVAYIKTENIASYKLFKKAGFGDEETSLYQGNQIYKLFKKS